MKSHPPPSIRISLRADRASTATELCSCARSVTQLPAGCGFQEERHTQEQKKGKKKERKKPYSWVTTPRMHTLTHTHSLSLSLSLTLTHTSTYLWPHTRAVRELKMRKCPGSRGSSGSPCVITHQIRPPRDVSAGVFVQRCTRPSHLPPLTHVHGMCTRTDALACNLAQSRRKGGLGAAVNPPCDTHTHTQFDHRRLNGILFMANFRPTHTCHEVKVENNV